MSILPWKIVKRRRAYVTVGLLAFALAALAWLCLDTSQPPLLRNFQRVQVGMSLADVEGILGPPSWESPTVGPNAPQLVFDGRPVTTIFCWRQDGHEATLFFVEGGELARKVYFSNSPRAKAQRWWHSMFGTPPPF